MSKKIMLVLAFMATLFFQSCTTTTLEPLKERDAVERTKTIVIFGLEWEEEFENLYNEEFEKRVSARYYADKNWPVADFTIDASHDAESRLPNIPSVVDFRVVLNGSTDKNFAVQFYNSFKKQHKFQPFALFAQTLMLEQILYNSLQLDLNHPNAVDSRFYPTPNRFNLPVHSVNLGSGEIVYGGTFKFYFKSQKQMFGLAPREQINSSVSLAGFEIIDQFDEMKSYMANNYPWFPAGEIRNASQSAAYKRDFLEWLPIEAEELSGEKERDKTKFFF